MVIIDFTIVNVALPTMAIDLNVGISGLQWIVAGYTLTFACLLLSAGHLGDRLGAKIAFLSGLGLFGLMSLGCGIASDLKILTTFRLLQGVAAALIVPTSLALINSSYQNKKDRIKAIGIWAGIGGIAAAAGPILGGVLTAYFGWRAVFLVNIPIAIIAIFLTSKYVQNPPSSQHENVQNGFDIAGQITAIISIAALAYSLIEAGKSGWLSEIVLSGFGVFLFAFISFLIIEKRSKSPIFPLEFFKSKTFSAGITVGMLMNIGGYGILFVLPLYFQHIREYSILMTGLAMLPIFAPIAIVSYFSGRLVSVMGPKLPMIVGSIIGAIGFLGLLITKEHAPSYLALVFPLIAIGVGPALLMPAATVAVLHSISQDRGGLVSGAFNASRQIGSLLGVAIFGSIVSSNAHFVSGMHICLIIAAIIFLCGCLVAFFCINQEDFVAIKE